MDQAKLKLRTTVYKDGCGNRLYRIGVCQDFVAGPEGMDGREVTADELPEGTSWVDPIDFHNAALTADLLQAVLAAKAALGTNPKLPADIAMLKIDVALERLEWIRRRYPGLAESYLTSGG